MRLRCRAGTIRGVRTAGALHADGACLTLSRAATRRASHMKCSALRPGGGKGPEGPFRKLVEQAERHAHQLMDCLTPKQEGDLADVSLILFSTLVFVWLAAGLYRLYAFAYVASGQQPIGSFWGH